MRNCADFADISLHSLDLSSVPFSILPHPQTLSLTHLVLRDTSLSLWADIDALEYATGGKLAVLRISLIGVIDADTEPINPDPRTMSGQMRHDRSLLVAKLSGLTMLNSTQVSMAERRDAELWYLGYVDRVGGRWGRYDDLSAQHGHNVARRVIPPSGLRSKMISEWYLAFLMLMIIKLSMYEDEMIPLTCTSSLQHPSLCCSGRLRERWEWPIFESGYGCGL